MIVVHVAGVGVRAPGLPGWVASRAVLQGAQPYVSAEIAVPAPASLSANERRRAGSVTRLALAVAEEATGHSGLPADSLRLVFATATGDGQTVHDILSAVTTPGEDVSPTKFHNSVHNAAAGYWSIATKSRQSITCLGCHEATAAAALLTAGAETVAENAATLLCIYDHPLPPPLCEKRPVAAAFAAALVVTPERSERTFATLALNWAAEPPAPAPGSLPGLDGNDAAQMLPLLALLTGDRRPGTVDLPYLDGRLRVSVTPA